MIGFKEPKEVLFHTAFMGHTGASGTELDYRATDNGLGHGVCIQCTYDKIQTFFVDEFLQKLFKNRAQIWQSKLFLVLMQNFLFHSSIGD